MPTIYSNPDTNVFGDVIVRQRVQLSGSGVGGSYEDVVIRLTKGTATIVAFDTAGVIGTLALGAGLSITSGTLNVTGGSGTFSFSDGTAAAPSITFTNEVTLGFYRSSAGTIAFSSGGIQSVSFQAGGIISGAQGVSQQLAMPSSGGISISASGTNQDVSISPSGTGRTTILTSTNQPIASLKRTGGTASQWSFYIPTGLDQLRIFSDTNNLDGPVFLVGGSTVRMLINTTTDSGALLQIGTNTTTSPGGAVFGTDCFLYRSASNVITNSGSFAMGGKITSYNGISTAGYGTPSIVAYGRVTAQTATAASVATFTVGASDGTFEISSNVLCTAFTSGSLNIQVAYTDEAGNAVAANFQGHFSSGYGTSVSGVGPFESQSLHIRAKASTAITISTIGTFALTYNAEAIIKQLA